VLSPNGRLLAFVAEDVRSGTTSISVRRLDSPDARRATVIASWPSLLAR
jgi:hypothetical protein